VTIAGPVGADATNKPSDVRAVRERLVDLGFTWVQGPPVVDAVLTHTLKLVRSILLGQHIVGGPGRVEIDAAWLADNGVAPRWVRMSARGLGFVNHERADLLDNHDFGTHWMDQTIRAAGADYERAHRLPNGAAVLTVNDVSIPRGGDTPDHSGHECGLACDLRLPRTDGHAGGLLYTDPLYDRNAARAQLTALHAQPLVKRVLFNDPVLVSEGLCWRARKHDDHIHFEITPGARREEGPEVG